MIGGGHAFHLTTIAFPRLCRWFVFAILFAPFQLVVAPPTHVSDRHGHDLGREFGIGIVLESKRILVGRALATGLWRHNGGRFSSSL